MRVARVVVLIFVCVASAVPLFSQQAVVTTEQATTLAQRSHAVLGGTTPISDVTLSGKARRIAGSIDETGTAVLKGLATGETRLDFTFPSGTLSEVISHSDKGPAGQWSGPDGKPHNIKQHNLATEAAWFFPALFMRRMITPQASALTHIGSETRDGHAVEHISASRQFKEMSAEIAPFMEGLSRSEVYLDSATLLPASISFNIHPDNDALRNIPVEVHFSDYRAVNGAQVPFHVQKYVNGGLVLDLQFETVTLNSGLSASAFSLQ